MATHPRLLPFLLLSLALHAGLLAIQTQPPFEPRKEPVLEVRLESAPPVLPPTPEPRTTPRPPTPKPEIREQAVAIPEIKPVQAAPSPSSPPVNSAMSVPMPVTPAAPVRVEKAQVAETPVIFDAAYLRNPPPEYPMQSRRLEEEGVTRLKVRVSAEGTPLSIEVAQSSGFKRLDVAAQEAVRQWRFVAARRDGQAMESSVIVPVRFRLNE